MPILMIAQIYPLFNKLEMIRFWCIEMWNNLIEWFASAMRTVCVCVCGFVRLSLVRSDLKQ